MRIRADLYRPDLTDEENAPSCNGSGNHAFDIPWPNNDDVNLYNLYSDKENRVYAIALNQGTGYHVSLSGMKPKTVPACQLPTCSLSLNKNLYYQGETNTITVTFNGKAYNKNIRLWVRKKDMTAVSQLQNIAIYTYHNTNPERNYYMVKTCNPGNYSGCSNTFTIPDNLPTGEYIVHCDTEPTAGRKCSGNSRCTYENNPYNEIPLFDCYDWRSCSDSDNAKFEVKYAPVPVLNDLIVAADGNANSVAASGISKLSGLRTDDQLNYRGSNYYNYLVVGQEVNPQTPDGSTDNIGLSGIIFGPSFSTSSPPPFISILTNVASNKGFILLYANKNYTAAESPLGFALTAKKYYLYLPKSNNASYYWEKDKSTIDPYDSIEIKSPSGNTIIKVKIKEPTACSNSNITSKAQLLCFHVYLYHELVGNIPLKTYQTYGFVYDAIRGNFIYKNTLNPSAKK
jgi:hypothetical protein